MVGERRVSVTLSNAYFYFSLTRKFVIIFGNMFNNITLMRKKTDGTEIERYKVPILYAPKEKYITRLHSDPDLSRESQITLPRMSFEIRNIEYDAARKQNSLLKVAKANNATRVASQYMGVPYDILFELNIYARNIDDGTHIIEQILPYFNPDYTVTVDSIPELGFLKDVPIVLTSVSNSIEHEGNFDSVRYVTWNLTFNMKAYYYGPVTTPKIIRKAITNIYNDPSLKAGYLVRINTDSGNNGTYKIDDIVYQGNDYATANAYGIVESWSAPNAKLVLGAAQGQFKVNNIIKAATTNAAYRLASFDATPLKLVKIVIEPDPIDAEANSDFGYTETITEFPNIVD
jgi:hypothetical protein